jgi:hypothetical protein
VHRHLLAIAQLQMQAHPNVTFGGGATETVMSPIALAALIIAMGLIFVLPRRRVVVPFLLFAFLIPLGQEFYIAGVHLLALRILILCGCMRLLISKRTRGQRLLAGGFNGIDKIFLAWAFCHSLAFVLLYQQGAAIANQLGFLWDAIGAYFLLRCLIRDERDIRQLARVFVVIASLMAVCMIYEHYTLKNVFALLMGGPVFAAVREGHVRARGVFMQQILAGAFGGTLVPFFIWLWKDGKSKAGAIAGVVSASIITITASSSTGITAFAAGVGTLCLWPLRRHMRLLCWALVIAIAGLALVMKAPVWYAIAHVDLAGGSTGWDRANLIDQFVKHFRDWWLFGSKNNDTWGFFTWDLCNEFVDEGERGGLATLIFFLILIWQCFSRIGKAQKTAEDRPAQERLVWTLAAIMAAHMAAFMGISYFDQTRVWWFATLAMVCATGAAARPSKNSKSQRARVLDLEHEIPETASAELVSRAYLRSAPAVDHQG